MAGINLDVYLYFDGDCREAMEFYKSIFGGELTVQTQGEVPGTDPAFKDAVMHARLEGGEIKLMASDSRQNATPSSKRPAARVELSLGGEDEAKMRAIFEKLSDGGEVRSELKTEFWGDIFGSLTDKYGIIWMMNIPKPGGTAK